DDISVATLGCSITLNTTDTTPSLGEQITLTAQGPANSPIDLLLAGGIGNTMVTLPNGRGTVRTDLRAPVQVRTSSTSNGSGTFTLNPRVPNQANLVGRSFYLQAFFSSGGQALQTGVVKETIRP